MERVWIWDGCTGGTVKFFCRRKILLNRLFSGIELIYTFEEGIVVTFLLGRIKLYKFVGWLGLIFERYKYKFNINLKKM